MLPGATASVHRTGRFKGACLAILRPTLNGPLTGDRITLKPVRPHVPFAACRSVNVVNQSRAAKEKPQVLSGAGPWLGNGRHGKARLDHHTAPSRMFRGYAFRCRLPHRQFALSASFRRCQAHRSKKITLHLLNPPLHQYLRYRFHPGLLQLAGYRHVGDPVPSPHLCDRDHS